MARRGRGEGSITWRADKGLWQGRIELERDSKGRRRRRTVYAPTKEKLLEKLNKARLAPDAVRSTDVKSVGELFDRFIAFTTSRRKASTVEHYTWALAKLAGVRALSLSKLTKARIVSAVAAVDGSQYTRYRVHRVLCSCLLWAVRHDYLAKSPAANLEAPPMGAEAEERVRYWTLDEANKFLAAANGHRWELLFVVLLGTGLRIGEALALRWSDIDLELGTVRIDRHLTEVRGVFRIETPKSKKSRRAVRLSQDNLRALAAAKSERKPAPDDLVFPAQRSGSFVRRSTLRHRVFLPLIAKAEVPVRTIHELRHTHATALLRAGVNIKTISERLGHASVQITWSTYAHVLPEAHAEAADMVDGLFGAKPPET